MRTLIAAAFLAATFTATASAQDKQLTVGQKITFKDGALPLDHFGCRNIENTKEAYRRWNQRSGSEMGRLAINRFVWEHDLDPTRANREQTLNEECQAFLPGDARYVEKIYEWRERYNTNQMVCLASHDFDPGPPDQSREPSPKSPCFWMITSMPPTIFRR